MTDSQIIPEKKTRSKKIDLNDETIINQVEILSGFGLSRKQIAQVIGISEDTLYRYQRNEAVFQEAIERGKSKMFAKSSQCLVKRVEEGDIGAIRWFEATRFGLSEKVRTENELTVKTQSIEDFIAEQKGIKNVSGRTIESDSITSKETQSLPIGSSDSDTDSNMERIEGLSDTKIDSVGSTKT